VKHTTAKGQLHRHVARQTYKCDYFNHIPQQSLPIFSFFTTISQLAPSL